MLRAYQNLSKPFESNQIERTAPQPAQQQPHTRTQTHTHTQIHQQALHAAVQARTR